jgi:hypothetical protein
MPIKGCSRVRTGNKGTSITRSGVRLASQCPPRPVFRVSDDPRLRTDGRWPSGRCWLQWRPAGHLRDESRSSPGRGGRPCWRRPDPPVSRLRDWPRRISVTSVAISVCADAPADLCWVADRRVGAGVRASRPPRRCSGDGASPRNVDPCAMGRRPRRSGDRDRASRLECQTPTVELNEEIRRWRPCVR